jgi:hypothetical protein
MKSKLSIALLVMSKLALAAVNFTIEYCNYTTQVYTYDNDITVQKGTWSMNPWTSSGELIGGGNLAPGTCKTFNRLYNDSDLHEAEKFFSFNQNHQYIRIFKLVQPLFDGNPYLGDEGPIIEEKAHNLTKCYNGFTAHSGDYYSITINLIINIYGNETYVVKDNYGGKNVAPYSCIYDGKEPNGPAK